MKRLSLLGILALGFTLSVLSGCPDEGNGGGNTEPRDAGPENPGDDDDAGVDAGEPDAGFKCRIDDDCSVFNAGLRCDYPTATCVPAKGCATAANCNENVQGAEYCSGIGCRCVTEPNDAGTSGVCKRRRGICEECTEDSQCGNDAIYFEPKGACRAMPDDTSGKKYCLQAAPICECGYTKDSAGYCKPASNQCNGTGCSQDTDCPGGSVCNVAQCLCEQRCRWDFQTQAEVPSCGPNKSCWVDQANLNPTSKFYGAGRCRPECADDSSCTDVASNPYGGPDLVCEAEDTEAGANTSTDRCRPDGQCMDNRECPVQPSGSSFNGYCDRVDRSCKTDCRIGTDPVTGLPWDDCRPGFKCAQNGATRQCVRKTCAELGGASVACSGNNQLCCGDDRDGNGSPDTCPATGLDQDKCYEAPKPPFCTTCQDDTACAALPKPSGSPLKNLCLGHQNPNTGQQIGVCAIATHSDFTPTQYGVPKANLGCPSGYSVMEVQFACETNADCSVGHTQGVCDFDPNQKLPDGGPGPKVCLCNDANTARCPNTGVCRSGTGQRACLESVVCRASDGVVFAPAGPGGCGL